MSLMDGKKTYIQVVTRTCNSYATCPTSLLVQSLFILHLDWFQTRSIMLS